MAVEFEKLKADGQLDANWTFEQDKFLGGVHRWGVGTSDNINDPIIIYDPWKNEFKIEANPKNPGIKYPDGLLTD